MLKSSRQLEEEGLMEIPAIQIHEVKSEQSIDANQIPAQEILSIEWEKIL